MRRLSSLAPAVIWASLAGTSAPAVTIATDPQLELFATCAGRLSARVEHDWTFASDHASATLAQRDAMVDLIAAVVTPDVGPRAMNIRIAAKVAHARLLRRAVYNDDAADAAWAARRADELEGECAAILL